MVVLSGRLGCLARTTKAFEHDVLNDNAHDPKECRDKMCMPMSKLRGDSLFTMVPLELLSGVGSSICAKEK